jgi:hypothetical protein
MTQMPLSPSYAPSAYKRARPPMPQIVRLLARQCATSRRYSPAAICTVSPFFAANAAARTVANCHPGPTVSTRPAAGGQPATVAGGGDEDGGVGDAGGGDGGGAGDGDGGEAGGGAGGVVTGSGASGIIQPPHAATKAVSTTPTPTRSNCIDGTSAVANITQIEGLTLTSIRQSESRSASYGLRRNDLRRRGSVDNRSLGGEEPLHAVHETFCLRRMLAAALAHADIELA